jgi:hypothetical protein
LNRACVLFGRRQAEAKREALENQTCDANGCDAGAPLPVEKLADFTKGMLPPDLDAAEKGIQFGRTTLMGDVLTKRDLRGTGYHGNQLSRAVCGG